MDSGTQIGRGIRGEGYFWGGGMGSTGRAYLLQVRAPSCCGAGDPICLLLLPKCSTPASEKGFFSEVWLGFVL